MKATIYVEILPVYWYDWRKLPNDIKVGRIRKRQPTGADRRNFTAIEIEVDERARWGTQRGVAAS